MKRTPLKRGKPLKRTTRLKVKGKSRFPKRRDLHYLAWIRERECCVPWCRILAEPAHLKTRGAGGDDLWNIVPLCRRHHREQEGRTRAFETQYGLDLTALAAQYTRQYHNETGRPI